MNIKKSDIEFYQKIKCWTKKLNFMTISLALQQKEKIRKTIHLSTAIIVLVNLVSHKLAIFLTLFVIFLYTFSEFARLRKIKIFYIHELVEICALPRESKRFILAPLLLAIPILFALIFFPVDIAYPAILTVTISDAFATLIGISFGKTKIFGNKTLEGSFAFFILTFLILLFFVNIFSAALIALITSLVELFSKNFDNATIPLAVIFLLVLF